MKIAIAGYSGSGKSTLARSLAEKYKCEALHFDRVQFLPGWEERSLEEEQRITLAFMDSHDAWVIDGNYTKLYWERRMEEADLIVLMLFNRFDCLRRVTKRYRKYKGKTRPDMGEGCSEKLDAAFVKWILWEGRGKKQRKNFASLASEYADKTVVIKNQSQLDKFYEEQGLAAFPHSAHRTPGLLG